MPHWTSLAPTVLAAFAASLVEFVEALTIVLAVGIVRGWRSPLLGAGAATVLLVALIASLGRSLAAVPLPVVQLVVGTLLLMFGLRWLGKAVLRAAGVIALHDEEAAFRDETAALRAKASTPLQAKLDTVAFAAAFKTVLLEGVEVVFIVVAIGAGGALIVPAAVGAGLALLAVVALGAALHRPLASLPENKLKFGVGVLLSAFGTFWVGQGLGFEWPAGDLAIFGLTLLFLVVAVCLVPVVRSMAWGRLDRGSHDAAAGRAAFRSLAIRSELGVQALRGRCMARARRLRLGRHGLGSACRRADSPDVPARRVRDRLACDACPERAAPGRALTCFLDRHPRLDAPAANPLGGGVVLS